MKIISVKNVDLKKSIFLLKSFYQTQSIKATQRAFQAEFKCSTSPGPSGNKKHRLHVRERRLSRLHNQKQEAAKRKTGGGQTS